MRLHFLLSETPTEGVTQALNEDVRTDFIEDNYVKYKNIFVNSLFPQSVINY